MATRRKKGRRQAVAGAVDRRWKYHIAWLLPGLLAWIVFLPVLDAGRVWDDSIVLETQLPAFNSVGDVFVPPENIPQWPDSYFRPLLTASYLLDQALFGANSTRGPHGMGIAYHGAATIFASLLALLALRGSRHRWLGALAAGSLFALYPLHTESVSWITGRSDTLVAFFLFPALGLAIVYRDQCSSWALGLSPFFFLCAALSKEGALAALALMPLFLALVPPRRAIAENEVKREGPARRPGPLWLKTWPLWALYAVVTLIYLGLRAASGASGGLSSLSSRGFLETAGRLGSALAYYLKQALVPLEQSVLVTDLPGSVATIAILAVGLTGLVFAFSRWRRGGEVIWLLGAAWFGLTLLPSLATAVLPLAEAPVAERYLYVPSFGLCLVFGAFVVEGFGRPAWRKTAVAFAIAVVVVAGWSTVRRNRVWQSDLSLWRDTVEKAPHLGLAWGELGKAYLDRGQDLEQALQAYEKSVERENDPLGRAISYNSIGVIYARQGREDKALIAWKTATRETSEYASAWFNLGNLLAKRFDRAQRNEGLFNLQVLAEARDSLSHAVELDPRYEKAWFRLIWCDVQKAVYLRSSGGDSTLAFASLAEAEENHQRFSALTPGSALVGEAGQMIERARILVHARELAGGPQSGLR